MYLRFRFPLITSEEFHFYSSFYEMFQFELKYSGTKYSYMYLYNQTGYKFMLVLFAWSTKILCIVIAFIIWLTCPPPKALWFYEKNILQFIFH